MSTLIIIKSSFLRSTNIAGPRVSSFKVDHIPRVFVFEFSLKPENILIGTDGYIKLTDFGLSKNNIEGDYDTFSVCGTP